MNDIKCSTTTDQNDEFLNFFTSLSGFPYRVEGDSLPQANACNNFDPPSEITNTNSMIISHQINNHLSHHHHYLNHNNNIPIKGPEPKLLPYNTGHDITHIKHDCMWTGSCLMDVSQEQDVSDEMLEPFDLNELEDVDEETLFNFLTMSNDLDFDEEDEQEEQQEKKALSNLIDNIFVDEDEEYGESNKVLPIDSLLCDKPTVKIEAKLTEEIDNIFCGDPTLKIEAEVLEQEISSIFYEDTNLQPGKDHSYAALLPIEENSSTLLSPHSTSMHQTFPCLNHFSSKDQQQQSSISPQPLRIVSRGKGPLLQLSSYHDINNPPKRKSLTRKIAGNNNNPKKPTIKRTKILVPVQELVENLKKKNFKISDIRPGVKVVRLFNGEKVQQLLDVKGAQCPEPAHLSTSAPTVSSSSSSVMSGSSQHQSKFPSRRKPKGKACNPNIEQPPIPPIILSKNLTSNTFVNKSNNSNSSSSYSSNTKDTVKNSRNTEKLRRIHIRNSFETLRKLVPTLNTKSKKKSSKIEVLNHATQYIYALKQEDQSLLSKERELENKRADLKHRISLLTDNNHYHH